MSSFCSRLGQPDKALYCSDYVVGNGESAGSLIKRCIVLDLRDLAWGSFVLDLRGNVRECGKSRNIAKAYKYKGLLSVFL
jgi:hypothetical protein